MKTIRRDWIKRQIEAGRMEAKCDYHYTDGDTADNFGKTGWLPACIGNFIDGHINFQEHDFRFKSGAAWKNEDETINLSVHSNLSYTLRLKGAYNE